MARTPRQTAAERLRREDNFECPKAAEDKALDKVNRKVAVAEYGYGPAKGAQRCGNCRVFDVSPWVVDCFREEGYCRINEFRCEPQSVCELWMEGGPMDSSIETGDIPMIRERAE